MPILTLTLITACTTGYLLIGYVFGPILLALVIAVYGLARRVKLTLAAPIGAASLAAVSIHAFQDVMSPDWTGLIIGTAWVIVPFAIGVTMRTRQDAVERDRTAQVRRHVDAERLRVSRDVHDVVGHGLAAINMQANLALRSVTRNPDRVPEALEAISSSSSAALAELRAVLARMDSNEPALRLPAPGLTALPTLVDRLGQTGMRVQLTGDTDVDVPPAVGLAMYRVAQESLTNALRHGTGNAAEVAVEARTSRISLTVTNPLPGTGGNVRIGPGSGLGIPGMRDRVEAVGGALTAIRDRNTFQVNATIPLQEATP